MTGNKTATLSVPITEARNGQKYRCIVKGADGKSVTSGEAAIKAILDTKITQNPQAFAGNPVRRFGTDFEHMHFLSDCLASQPFQGLLRPKARAVLRLHTAAYYPLSHFPSAFTKTISGSTSKKAVLQTKVLQYRLFK